MIVGLSQKEWDDLKSMYDKLSLDDFIKYLLEQGFSTEEIIEIIKKFCPSMSVELLTIHIKSIIKSDGPTWVPEVK